MVFSSSSPGKAEEVRGPDLFRHQNSPCLTGIREAERCRLMSGTSDSCPCLRVSWPTVKKIDVCVASVANISLVTQTIKL